MINTTWRRAYDAWQASGLSRAAFHRTHITTFFPEGTPSIWTLYGKFRKIDLALRTEAGNAVDRQESGTVAVVELPTASAATTRMPACRPAQEKTGVQSSSFIRSLCAMKRPERKVRLVLPNGSMLEFSSESPELLAIGMMQAAGGSS